MSSPKLESTARVRVVELLSEGEVVGLADGLKSVWLEDTRVQNNDDTYNFSGFDLEFITGQPGQLLSRTLTQLEQEPLTIGVPVKFTKDITRTLEDTRLEACRIIITFESLFKQRQSTGQTYDGQVNVAIAVFDADGIEHGVVSDTVTGIELGPFDVQYEFNLDGPGPWNVRVTRENRDDPDPFEHSNFSWSKAVGIIRRQFMYDGSCVAGMVFDMQSFGGSLPRRKYDLIGLKLQIPNNYDPITRVYAGIWDGTFKEAWTDNPAWVCFNVLYNTRWGMGLVLANIDRFSFYKVAKWADELISNNKGGTEPRFTFNGPITAEEDAYTVAQAVASSFQGQVCWAGHIAMLTADMPDDLFKVVTNADTVDGSFSYQDVPISSSFSVALVTFTDPASGEPDIEVVEDNDLIAQFGYREQPMYAMGCTRRTQARRLGLWALDTIKNEAETVVYRAGWDNVDCTVGSIVGVADSDTALLQNGGRIKAAPTLSQLVLDRAIAIDSPVTLYITMPNSTIVTVQAFSGAAPTAIVNLRTPLVTKPLIGAVWASETADTRIRLVRCVGIKEQGKGVFELACLTYDPNKRARVEAQKHIAPPNYTSPDSLIAPLTVQVGRYYTLAARGGLDAVLFALWERGDERVYIYELQVRSGNSWLPALRVRSLSAEYIDNAFIYDAVRVRGVDIIGNLSAWTTAAVQVISATVTVGVVELGARGSRQISWDYPALPAFGAVVQIMLDGRAWQTAPLAANGFVATDIPLTGSHTVQVLVAPGISGSYFLAPLMQVAGLAVTFVRAVRDGAFFVLPTLTWTAKVGASYYEVWQKIGSSTWQLLATPTVLTADPTALVGNEANATRLYAVVAVSADGARLDPQDAAQLAFLPGFDTTPPAQPTGLALEETVERLRRFRWTQGTETDLDGYQIRAIIGEGLDYGNGVPLHTGLIASSPFELRSVPAFTTALGITAWDKSKNQSIPNFLLVNLTERPPENIVLQIDAGPTWTGTLSKGSISSGVILGPSVTPLMWNTVGTTPMWKIDGSQPMWSAGDYQAFDYVQAFTVPTGILTIQALFTGPVRFEYKIDAGAYTIYSSPVRIPACTLTVHAYGADGTAVENKLNQLSIIIDVDDVIESVPTVTFAVGGTRVPKVKTYSAILDVIPTLVEQSPAVRYEVVDKNPTTGPLVKVRRISDGVDVGGSATSVLLKGYQ